MGRPFAASPDIPADRKAALLKAFDATMKDPEFLAATASQQMEVIEAVRWVVAHAKEFGADPNKILLCGHSSGAHLAVSCCVRLAREYADNAGHAVKAAIVTSGIYDLEPVRRSYLNGDARLSRVDVAQLSPATAVTCLKIPIMVAVGEDESSEFIKQSDNLVSALRLLGAMPTFYPIYGTNHYTMLEQWRPGSELLNRWNATISEMREGADPQDCL